MIVTSSKKFNNQLSKVPENIQFKFFERLEMFKQNKYHPLLNNHKLHGEWFNHNSINITSDVRTIYKQNFETITFVAIGSHSDLYQ